MILLISYSIFRIKVPLEGGGSDPNFFGRGGSGLGIKALYPAIYSTYRPALVALTIIIGSVNTE